MSDAAPLLRCETCGRQVAEDFRFCPRCGRPLADDRDFQDVLDGSFARLASAEASRSVRKLELLDWTLRELESELEALASHAEAERPRRR